MINKIKHTRIEGILLENDDNAKENDKRKSERKWGCRRNVVIGGLDLICVKFICCCGSMNTGAILFTVDYILHMCVLAS